MIPEGLTELMLELENKDKILADQTTRLYNFHNKLFTVSITCFNFLFW